MRVKACLCATLILLLLSLAACTDLDDNNPSADPIAEAKITVAPADLTSNEEWLLSACSNLFFVYDLYLENADEDIYCNVWMEHYVKGEKQDYNVLNFTSVVDSSLEKVRMIVALLRQTEDEEVWMASISDCKQQGERPKSPDGIRTWESTPEQDIELEQAVMLGYLVSGTNEINSFGQQVVTNQKAFEALLQNDVVDVIYMKSSQSPPKH